MTLIYVVMIFVVCGGLAICCLVLSDKQLCTILAKIMSSSLSGPSPLRKLNRRSHPEYNAITEPKLSGEAKADGKLRQDLTLREQEDSILNRHSWKIMSFRVLVLGLLFSFFVRGWSSTGSYGKFCAH